MRFVGGAGYVSPHKIILCLGLGGDQGFGTAKLNFPGQLICTCNINKGVTPT